AAGIEPEHPALDAEPPGDRVAERHRGAVALEHPFELHDGRAVERERHHRTGAACCSSPPIARQIRFPRRAGFAAMLKQYGRVATPSSAGTWMQHRTSRRAGAASAPPTDIATTAATNQNVRIVTPPRGRAGASWAAATTRQSLIEEHFRRSRCL